MIHALVSYKGYNPSCSQTSLILSFTFVYILHMHSVVCVGDLKHDIYTIGLSGLKKDPDTSIWC